MEINIKKTEIMVFTKKANSDAPQCNIYLNRKKLKQEEHFKYLGCMLSWSCREDKEMTIRFEQAKSAFKEMKSILCSKTLSFVQITLSCAQVLHLFDFYLLLRNMDYLQSHGITNSGIRDVVLQAYAKNFMEN